VTRLVPSAMMPTLLPAVLRDWRGFFLESVMAERLAVFLDYQNVHLVAHGLFMPYGAPVEQSLVHPVLIGEGLAAKRKIEGVVTSIRVFRGRPNPEHHPTPTAANDAQTAAWDRDPRVRTVRRDLN
jgi:hypothetical protein